MTLTDTILAALAGLVVITAVVLLLILRAGGKFNDAGKSLRINNEAWLRLDTLAKELSTPNDPKTAQDFIEEGIAMVLQKYGKPPVS